MLPGQLVPNTHKQAIIDAEAKLDKAMANPILAPHLKITPSLKSLLNHSLELAKKPTFQKVGFGVVIVGGVAYGVQKYKLIPRLKMYFEEPKQMPTKTTERVQMPTSAPTNWLKVIGWTVFGVLLAIGIIACCCNRELLCVEMIEAGDVEQSNDVDSNKDKDISKR